MFEILLTILASSVTPIASFVLMLIAGSILHNAGLYALALVINVILLAVMVISTLINLSAYGMFMKRLSLILCAVAALVLFLDNAPGKTNPANVPAANAYSYNHIDHYEYDGGYDIPFTGNDNGGASNKRDKTCYACNGSRKCHVCSGKGYHYCSGTCISGKCRSCKGTGIYDHGSYASKCIVCSGDGRCDICNGTNMVDCSICHGRGRCTHCS